MQALSWESVDARVEIISASLKVSKGVAELLDSYLQEYEPQVTTSIPRSIMEEVRKRHQPVTDFRVNVSRITFINPPRSYHLAIVPRDKNKSSMICEYSDKSKMTFGSLVISDEMPQFLYTETELRVHRLFFSAKNKGVLEVDVIELVYQRSVQGGPSPSSTSIRLLQGESSNKFI